MASRSSRLLGSATALKGSCVVGLRAIALLYSYIGIYPVQILEYSFWFVKRKMVEFLFFKEQGDGNAGTTHPLTPLRKGANNG
jgi:hypothetical protein